MTGDVIRILILWLVISPLVGAIVGKWIAAGMRDRDETECGG